MRGQALGNKEHQGLRRSNLLTWSVILLLLQTAIFWSCGSLIQFAQRHTCTKKKKLAITLSFMSPALGVIVVN
jgi:type VI protein secretion system component VasK